jgi:hypothetical protein
MQDSSSLKDVLSQLQSLKKSVDANNQLKYKLNTPANAIEEYKTNPDFKKEINDIDSKFHATKKLRKLEAAVGQKFMANFEPDYPNMKSSDKYHYLETVYADDIGALLGLAAPYVGPALRGLVGHFGPKLLDWLINGAERIFKGRGSGPGYKTMMCQAPMIVDQNTVSTAYFKSVLCPEKYRSLTPDSFNSQLCKASRTISFNWFTASDGNGVFYMQPDMVFADAIGSYFYATNTTGGTTTVDLVTGIPSGYTLVGGPYRTSNTSVSTYRVTSASVRFVPLQSTLNRQGTLLAAMFPEPPNQLTPSLTPSIPNTMILQAPFGHGSSIPQLSESRLIHVPHDVTDLDLDIVNSTSLSMQSDVLCGQIQGGTPNTAVFTVYITVNIDFMPTSQLIGMVNPEPSPDAPGSIPALCSLFKKMPQCVIMSLDEALRFVEQFDDSDPSYTGVLKKAYSLNSTMSTKMSLSNFSSGSSDAPGDVLDITF